MAKRDKILFSRRLARSEHISRIKGYMEGVLGVDYRDYIHGRLYTTWIDDIGVIHCIDKESVLDIKATIVYQGKWVGLIISGKPYLSPIVYQEVFRDKGYRAAVIVSEKAVKNFLYGRDILASSILESYPPLYNPVAIIDPVDHRVIGVGEPVVDKELFKKYIVEKLLKPIYRNVYDLGLFLRLFG